MVSIRSLIEKAVEEVEDMWVVSVDFFEFFTLILSNISYPLRFWGKLCNFLENLYLALFNNFT